MSWRQHTSWFSAGEMLASLLEHSHARMLDHGHAVAPWHCGPRRLLNARNLVEALSVERAVGRSGLSMCLSACQAGCLSVCHTGCVSACQTDCLFLVCMSVRLRQAASTKEGSIATGS